MTVRIESVVWIVWLVKLESFNVVKICNATEKVVDRPKSYKIAKCKGPPEAEKSSYFVEHISLSEVILLYRVHYWTCASYDCLPLFFLKPLDAQSGPVGRQILWYDVCKSRTNNRTMRTHRWLERKLCRWDFQWHYTRIMWHLTLPLCVWSNNTFIVCNADMACQRISVSLEILCRRW